jgi:CHAT domain-containing protein
LSQGKRDKHSTNFFAVYEEPSKADERDLIFSHIRSLPSIFPGSISVGPEVTKAHFLKQCSMASWVHYHGHAQYDKDDVLKSSLVLSDGIDILAESIDDGNVDLGRDELSVSELFTTNLPSGGVHFTIIACDSGTQDIAPGDEPLGIIPALLHAGATSVLGCQWPIDSRAGRAFSEAFYEELSRTGTEIEDSSNNNTVHVAKALRNTVGRMSSGKLGVLFKQPYYWASFALHGLWFYPGLSCSSDGTVRDIGSTRR